MKELNGKSMAYVSWDINEDFILNEDNEEVSSGEYVLIEKVYVPVEQRRQGVATKILLDAIEDIKKKHTGMDIRLAALPDSGEDEIEMDNLVSFYERIGFTVESAEGPAVIMIL